MEDKQNICDLLCKTLKATRQHEDIESITYSKSEETETATVKWENGGTKNIDVTADSGIAIIQDILMFIN